MSIDFLDDLEAGELSVEFEGEEPDVVLEWIDFFGQKENFQGFMQVLQYYPTQADLPDVDLVAPRVGVAYRYAFTKDVIFAEEASAMVNVVGDTSGRVMLGSTTKLSSHLTSSVAFGVGFMISHDTQPPPPKVKTDTALTESDRALRESLTPLPGLLHYYVGIDRVNGYLTNVSVWDSVEHAHQMDTLAVMLAQRPLLEAAGVKPTPIDHEVTKSLYFEDPDGHNMELLTRA